MDNVFVYYAPFIVVILLFLWNNKVFVTPEQMSNKFISFEQHLEEKFVLKQAYDVAISEIKADNQEIKERLDKIYNKLMALG